LQNALAHIHQSDKLVALYCLQLPISAEAPPCQLQRWSELGWPAAKKTLLQYPSTSAG